MNQWTVMIYMAADNSLFSASKRSFRLLGESGSTSDTQIVLQWDGPETQDTKRYRFEGRAPEREKIDIPQEPDDRGKRLADFLKWCIDKYPAIKYCLILWGHGDGVDHSYVYREDAADKSHIPAEYQLDDITGKISGTSLAQDAHIYQHFFEGMLHGANANHYLRDVGLKNILKDLPIKIDLLGFDACLMGMIEVCYEFRDEVSRIVASNQIIPNQGWPYDSILTDLARNPGLDGSLLSVLIVRRFLESYAKKRNKRAVSLSSFNLASSNEVALAVSELAVALENLACNSRGREVIAQARQVAQDIREPNYIDLCLFCKQLLRSAGGTDQVCRESERVLSIIRYRPFISYHEHSNTKKLKPSTGLSIYFPTQIPVGVSLPADKKTSRPIPTKHNRKPAEPPIASFAVIWDEYKALDFCKETKWVEFLEGFLR